MFVSDTTVHLNTYAEIPPNVSIGYEINDDTVEITVGEHSRILGLFDGVTMTFEERSLQRMIDVLSEGLAALRAEGLDQGHA